MGSRLPKRMAMLLSPGFVFLALLTNTSAQTGAIRQVHDPCIIKEKNTYYLFSTGRGIRIRTSTDLIQWNMRGRVFDATPEWTLTEVPGSRGYYWAPDISFFNGKFHLYYSVSTFGSRRSCIGLATNMTLNPQDKNYRWVDEGKVIESRRSDDWNAIDPNILLDETGRSLAVARFLLEWHQNHPDQSPHGQAIKTVPGVHSGTTWQQCSRSPFHHSPEWLLLPVRFLGLLLQGGQQRLQDCGWAFQKCYRTLLGSGREADAERRWHPRPRKLRALPWAGA